MTFRSLYPEGNKLSLHIAFIIVVNILLLFVPLTNVFGYEFSAVNALILFFQAGIFTISNLKKTHQDVKIRTALLYTIAGLLPLVILPLLISLTHSLFTDGCSYKDGFLFFTFITLPSVFSGSAAGILIFSLFSKYKRPVFLALFFMLILIPVLEFYFNPQVYFYTPLVGFIPGIIYDEGLSINGQIIFYRVINLIYFSAIILLSILIIGKAVKYKIIFAGSLIITSVIFIIISPWLGFSTTRGRLESELGKKIETKHFTIHFSRRIDDNFVRLISLQHEFYYSELAEYFNSYPEDKIISFVFYDRTEKKILLGSENADVAKPWLNQMFTSYENYNHSLKHELAHVFSAEFGKGLLKIADNFNPSLIEGVAVAADPVYGDNTIDFMAALAYNNGYKTNMNMLYSHVNFFKQNSSLSYIYAGSFTKYLIDNYGINKFKKLYSDLEFNEVYGKNFEDLTREYYRYLRTIEDSYNVHAANFYFGKKSIFFKVCPRHVYDQIRIGWIKYDQKDYCASRDIFKQSYDLSDDYSALYGYINSLSKLKERTAAIDFLNSEISKFEGTSSYYNLEMRLADLYAEEGEFVKADSLYLEILRQNPGHNFYYISNTRMLLARDNSTLRMYLSGSDFTRYYLLKKYYSKRSNYNLLPVMIDLSKRLDEDYRLFISQFSTRISDETYESSYAFYKLSNYMLENLDFINARKMASLALRYREDKNFQELLERNQFKIMWLQNNHETLLAAINEQM